MARIVTRFQTCTAPTSFIVSLVLLVTKARHRVRVDVIGNGDYDEDDNVRKR